MSKRTEAKSREARRALLHQRRLNREARARAHEEQARPKSVRWPEDFTLPQERSALLREFLPVKVTRTTLCDT